MKANIPDRMRAVEAADYLRVSRSTLAKWRMRNYGPPFHRCGGRLVIYLRFEVDEWLRSCDERRYSHRRVASGADES